ncbi:MAG: chromate transporter [Clostridiales bacterium]|nr:chromate transporter [Clostridiales bacterium]
MNKYLDIFLTFSRVGAFTFGGGYSMLPILQREVVEAKGWVEEREVLDFYSISQVLPGMIGINTAIFIGNKVKGRWGGVLAALGVAFPSLVIIMVIAAFISNFVHLPLVQNAFAGIRACVFVLILRSIIKLFRGSVIDWFSFVICVSIFLLSVLTDINPILYVVAAGLLGLIYRRARSIEKA